MWGPKTWKRTQQERIEQVNHICRGMAIYDIIPSYEHQNALKHFLVDDHHKVLFCSIPKVASTTIKRQFLYINGKDIPVSQAGIVHDTNLLEKAGLNSLGKYNKPERNYRLKNNYKFFCG